MNLRLKAHFSSTLSIKRKEDTDSFPATGNGEMKYIGNFHDLESAQACADLLDLSKN